MIVSFRIQKGKKVDCVSFKILDNILFGALKEIPTPRRKYYILRVCKVLCNCKLWIKCRTQYNVYYAGLEKL